MGLVFAALGGPIVLATLRRARLESRALERGIHTKGTITELTERSLKTNGVRVWGLRYGYTDFHGHRHEGTIDLPADEAQAWKVGDLCSVSYDPERPTEAVWLGRADS
jgi:hypothetical protein